MIGSASSEALCARALAILRSSVLARPDLFTSDLLVDRCYFVVRSFFFNYLVYGSADSFFQDFKKNFFDFFVKIKLYFDFFLIFFFYKFSVAVPKPG